jgi:hypothetical protein
VQFQSQLSLREGYAAHRFSVIHLAAYESTPEDEAIDPFCDQLLGLGDEPTNSDLFIDFGSIASISAGTLGTLITLRQRLLANGRRMTIANLCPQVYEVFVVARLERVFDLRLGGKPGDSAIG